MIIIIINNNSINSKNNITNMNHFFLETFGELLYIYTYLLLNLLGLWEHNGELQRKHNGVKGKFGEEWTL